MLRAALLGLTLCLGAPVGAQEASDTTQFPLSTVRSSILTVEIDRLFSETLFGARVVSDYNADRAELAAENRSIAEALRAEELALASRRDGMDPDVFRVEAEAFDLKTQGIRRAQDAKETALDDALSTGRDQFLEAARPVLGQLLLDRNASVIVDRRSVLVSLGVIDITDEAIARIDASVGEGVTAQDTQEDAQTDPVADPVADPQADPETPEN